MPRKKSLKETLMITIDPAIPLDGTIKKTLEDIEATGILLILKKRGDTPEMYAYTSLLHGLDTEDLAAVVTSILTKHPEVKDILWGHSATGVV
jgi:hypothetical protein